MGYSIKYHPSCSERLKSDSSITDTALKSICKFNKIREVLFYDAEGIVPTAVLNSKYTILRKALNKKIKILSLYLGKDSVFDNILEFFNKVLPTKELDRFPAHFLVGRNGDIFKINDTDYSIDLNEENTDSIIICLIYHDPLISVKNCNINNTIIINDQEEYTTDHLNLIAFGDYLLPTVFQIHSLLKILSIYLPGREIYLPKNSAMQNIKLALYVKSIDLSKDIFIKHKDNSFNFLSLPEDMYVYSPRQAGIIDIRTYLKEQ